MTLKTVKLASTRWLDTLPTTGSKAGHAIRDLEMEQKVLELSRTLGIGAQFGGKYFCHDVRVIRLPRHGASLPVGIGVSCSADRQIMAKITPEGVFLEQLETDPAKYLPETTDEHLGDEAVAVDLNRPMAEIRRQLSAYPVKTRLMLTGTMVVARDIAHAKLQERLDRGEGLPDYIKDHPVYYAGPAKTPTGYATGSFGPTTAGRMDSYVPAFQAAGGSLVMLAKGNRSKAVKDACKREWRVLSRQRRRPGGAAGAGLHPQGRGAGVSGTRHGSGVAHRSGGFPGIHRDRRQGQRFLRRAGVAVGTPRRRGSERALQRDAGVDGGSRDSRFPTVIRMMRSTKDPRGSKSPGSTRLPPTSCRHHTTAPQFKRLFPRDPRRIST